MTDLDIVIVNYNTKDLTLKTLRSILNNNWKANLKIWLVDNASTDGSVNEIKKEFPKLEIIESDINLGFSKGNNLALRKTIAPMVLLLNSDTEVLEGSLDKLVTFANSSDYGIISPQLLNTDRSFQSNGGKLPTFINTFLWLSGLDDILNIDSYQSKKKTYFQRVKVGWVGGTAMLIKRETIEKIGLLDDKIFMYGEDVEYCLRASKKGIKVGWFEEAQIIHLGGGSLDVPRFRQWLGEFRGILYIYQKYYGLVSAFFLRFLIYIFVILRSIAFLIVGKGDHAKTYVKVAFNL